MKKVLIGLLILATISIFASQGINVYGRIGLGVHSNFTAVKDEDEKLFYLKEKKLVELFL